MSLRTEIKDAIDEVTPPAPALESRVTALVVADGKDRRVSMQRRRSPWNNPFRGVGALVAAALVMALVGGIILGGRLMRDQNLPPQGVSQNELKNLESRSLLFPVVQPGAQCPQSPFTLPAWSPTWTNEVGPVYYIQYDSPTTTSWGDWSANRFIYDATEPGLVLLRARDLQANKAIPFAQYPFGPSAVTAVGPQLGTDRIPDHTLRLRPEAVMQDAAHTAPVNKQGRLPSLLVMVGLEKGFSGCIGLQFDGPGFTENLVLDWTPPYF